jgi:hypothetical protein
MPELRDELTRAGASEREAAELAALLFRAAEPARFEVAADEVERALARVRPLRRARQWPRVAVATAAVAVVVFALVLFVPSRQQSVQARALAAFGGDDTVLHLQEAIFTRIAGVAESDRDVWLDPSRGRARWTQTGGGGIVADTYVEPGRFVRFLQMTGTRLVGTSCRSFAAGCAELIDPVTRYRDELRRSTTRAVRTTFGGRETYRLILPLQGRIDQVVFVDKQTFLPRTIEWRELLPSGRRFVVTTIEITGVERIARADVPSGTFRAPHIGRVVHVMPAGRKLGERTLTLPQARRLHPYWLGLRGLTSIVERRYERGRVVIARYGMRELWSYGRAVPPELLAQRLAENKPLVVNGVPATMFPLGVRLVVVRETGTHSLAVVEPFVTKEQLVADLLRARRLR